MTSFLLPPTFMPATPVSQPLITSPTPRRKVKGLLREESNDLPFVRNPLYSTLT
jgi:hypothetical protein